MNLDDRAVLDVVNQLIITKRLNKSQILKMVELVPISNDIKDLRDNLNWESSDKKGVY